MAMRVVLLLTLFTGLRVADSQAVDKPAYFCVPGNLALGATAVQSSTWGGAGAQRAVDGNRDSIWSGGSCSHTDADRDPWWRVDLGKAYEVTRVSITNRGDGYAERINGAQIRIGNSLDNEGNNNELAATVVSIPTGVTETFMFKPINGQYVNIYIPGRNEYLTLCEVEVFAEKYTSTYNCVPRNLALGATAVQSSTYSGLGAERAVDGNRDSGVPCSVTNGEQNPWWRVDLGKAYEVTRVRITDSGIWNTSITMSGAQIRIGNSLDNNGNNNDLAATVVAMSPGETKTFEFKPIKGRYVNIIIPGRNEYLTLCEVEVFAD
ncbi:hypothetical protein R3I94_019288 [Phoxinus phoxinus]